MKAQNPILPGFYPDPSICRVEDTFYLVCSTFAYFPGVPIFKSKDLAKWEQIGNVLCTDEQLPLQECWHSAGIYAPTIRYHEGTFYMITTNVSGGGNFIVTAKDPKGPWSKPYFLGEAAGGIDPSLYFENGKCYYVGTRGNSDEVRYYGDGEIWAQELDLNEMKLTGESHIIWYGAMKNAVWAEGPHIYKKDDYYYLLIAEGGTGFDHAITIARSKEIFGPYEGHVKNPIFTHRHLGKNYPIQYTGHGDLVCDENDNWFMVMLGSRPFEGHTNLGRETFLAKVIWEDGWPVVNPGIGKLEEWVETGLGGESEADQKKHYYYDFKEKTLPFEMITVRNPISGMYSLGENHEGLRLYANKERIARQESASYIGIRQNSYEYCVETKLKLGGQKEDISNIEAGLVVLQNNNYHIRFTLNENAGASEIVLIQCLDGAETVLAKEQVEAKEILLRIAAKDQMATFSYEAEDVKKVLKEMVDTKFLSTETASGFVGCSIGMYASANGNESQAYADFGWFSYKI